MLKKCLFVMIALVLVSCSAQKQLIRIGHSPTFKEGWYTVVRNYNVVYMEEPTFFLAVDEDGAGLKAIAVSILPEEGPVHVGKKISGPYVMIDTYTYKTKAGGVNVVPLVVSLKHYEMLRNTEDCVTRYRPEEGRVILLRLTV